MPAHHTNSLSNEFAEAWSRCFGQSPPLGHVLRHDCSQIWTRFHALPKSKRFAENDEEVGIVLERANALATECFGECARVWIVAAVLSDFDLGSGALPCRMNMSKAMVWIDKDEEPEDQLEWSFFASRVDWKRSRFDRLFRNIADDHEQAVLFSEEAQTVFAPYDGGFDIVSFQPGKIVRLEDTYPTWMSTRSDKL